MSNIPFDELNHAVSNPEELNKTVHYLAQKLGQFMRTHERMLICFPDEGEGSIGGLMARAVRICGGVPIFWGPDHRWITLLRQAFTTRASAIVGPPLVILGLTKLAKATGTPLYLRDVVTAGYPCLDWMIDGIRQGLDCQTWGCFGPGARAVVGGFSCGKSRGVHIRDDVFGFDIVDQQGNRVSRGETGSMAIYLKERPELRYCLTESARLEVEPCPCGCTAPRLMDLGPGQTRDPELSKLTEQLLRWTSILDCRLDRGECGLEMELVVFPGEKLPQMPTCAKRNVRVWNRDEDVPMQMRPGWAIV